MLDIKTFEQVPLEVVQKVIAEEIKRAGKKKEPQQAIFEAKLPSMENSSDEKKAKPWSLPRCRSARTTNHWLAESSERAAARARAALRERLSKRRLCQSR